ncbi:MAG TPA: extracellular solute-binding protein [Thermomicrobiales bacterium]|nr:extracellular solute-binding protein [Thermomicrobiales bacterium]
MTASAVLTGCIAESNPAGPVVPTPSSPPVDPPEVAGLPGRYAGRTFRVAGAGDDARDAVMRVLWQPFATETGCGLDAGITDYGVLAADGAGEQVDLALVSDEWALRLGNADALAPLDAVGSDGTVPDLIAPSATAVPAFADALVNASRVDAAAPGSYPVNWPEWWAFRERPGGRAMMKGPVGTFEFALLADGVPPTELYPLDIERAITSLRRVSGSILDRWWDTGPQAVDWLSSGRALFAMAYNRQVMAASRAGRSVRKELNQGALFAEHWVVPSAAANADIARDFISWALSVPAQAALAAVANLSPVSSMVFPAIDPFLARQLPTSPANMPSMIRLDPAWWEANRTLATEAFNGWLLGNPRGF